MKPSVTVRAATPDRDSPRPVRRRWAVIAIASAAALTAPLTTGNVTPARAATCIHPTLKYYPGATDEKWRYGEADFHFDVCQETPASTWTATASVRTNGTGRTLGYTFDNASIVVTGGTTDRDYDGRFDYHSCNPTTGFPCAHSGTFHIYFHAFKTQGGTPEVISPRSSTPAREFTIYSTP